MKKMNKSKWEDSAKDEAIDRKMMKKTGMSKTAWEKSAMDKKLDKKAMNKSSRGR